MKTRRGDVVLVLFPNSDLRTAKRRPALVLERDDLSTGLDHAEICAPTILVACTKSWLEGAGYLGFTSTKLSQS